MTVCLFPRLTFEVIMSAMTSVGFHCSPVARTISYCLQKIHVSVHSLICQANVGMIGKFIILKSSIFWVNSQPSRCSAEPWLAKTETSCGRSAQSPPHDKETIKGPAEEHAQLQEREPHARGPQCVFEQTGSHFLKTPFALIVVELDVSVDVILRAYQGLCLWGCVYWDTEQRLLLHA